VQFILLSANEKVAVSIFEGARVLRTHADGVVHHGRRGRVRDLEIGGALVNGEISRGVKVGIDPRPDIHVLAVFVIREAAKHCGIHAESHDLAWSFDDGATEDVFQVGIGIERLTLDHAE